jgi:hypothetical protein
MDITKLYNTIIERLDKSGYHEVVADLERLTAAAATGGEGLASTGFYLSSLRHNNPVAYELLKDQIKEYLAYCKQNGLIIR